MQLGPSILDEYARAVASEQAAWEAVRHRLPGTANFNHELWARWRTCVDEADRAAGRARSRRGSPLLQVEPKAALRGESRWAQAIRMPPIFSRRPKV